MNRFHSIQGRLLLAAGTSMLVGAALAQTPPPALAPDNTGETAQPGPRIQHITNEDALARIEEVRVGGETKSIEVQPKNGAPGYQINPGKPGDGLGDSAGQRSGSAGKSSWRILNF